MIDTHSHIYAEEFDQDREAVIERAKKAGVNHIVLANTDEESVMRIVSTYLSDQDYFIPSIGLHPTELKEDSGLQMQEIEKHFSDIEFRAVGEIGLDLHWDGSRLKDQLEIFARQIKWASELSLPILVHVRDAYEEFHQIMKKNSSLKMRGIIHSFSGTYEDAQKIFSYGDFLLGINGTITYKKSLLPQEIEKIGPEHLVLETDAPYLSPVPFRGKRNESSYLDYTCEKLAQILGMDSKEMEKITDRNAKMMFFGAL